ncbi:MAG: hypothetical protein R3D57_11635 [Hyphomicrobiaceae bacterium]
MATFRGTSRSDVLSGTSGADLIQGLDGSDPLFGGRGNDILNGGSGFDTAAFEDTSRPLGSTLRLARQPASERIP